MTHQALTNCPKCTARLEIYSGGDLYCPKCEKHIAHTKPGQTDSEVEKRIIREGMLCTRCLGRIVPKTAEKGDLAIEILLWLFMILPGLLYSIWRRSDVQRVCPSCGSVDLVPFDSERARTIFGDATWKETVDLQRKYRSEGPVVGWEV